MSHVVAADVPPVHLGDYQRAVRALLVHTVVTRHRPDGETLALVRRFEPTLRADLDAVAGYQLELTDTAARLVRRLDRLDPTQALEIRKSGGRQAFDRRRSAYLALTLACLEGVEEQITLSDLAVRLTAMAEAIPGLGFDQSRAAERRALADVLRWLEERGALTTVERASDVSWESDPSRGEVLYDLDRDVCMLLFSPPRAVDRVRSVSELAHAPPPATPEGARAEVRQRLARLLLEHPVLYDADLPPEDAARLAREHRVLAMQLETLTGAELERRAEGAALVAGRSFTAWSFPDAGTVTQAALLLVDRMSGAVRGDDPAVGRHAHPAARERLDALARAIDRARPALASPPEVDPAAVSAEVSVEGAEARASAPDASTPPPDRPFLADAWVGAAVEDLCASRGRHFSVRYRDAPAQLAREVLALLESFDLVRSVPGGVVVMPAAARFRDPTVRTSSLERNLGLPFGGNDDGGGAWS